MPLFQFLGNLGAPSTVSADQLRELNVKVDDAEPAASSSTTKDE